MTITLLCVCFLRVYTRDGLTQLWGKEPVKTKMTRAPHGHGEASPLLRPLLSLVTCYPPFTTQLRGRLLQLDFSEVGARKQEKLKDWPPEILEGAGPAGSLGKGGLCPGLAGLSGDRPGASEAAGAGGARPKSPHHRSEEREKPRTSVLPRV